MFSLLKKLFNCESSAARIWPWPQDRYVDVPAVIFTQPAREHFVKKYANLSHAGKYLREMQGYIRNTPGIDSDDILFKKARHLGGCIEYVASAIENAPKTDKYVRLPDYHVEKLVKSYADIITFANRYLRRDEDVSVLPTTSSILYYTNTQHAALTDFADTVQHMHGVVMDAIITRNQMAERAQRRQQPVAVYN
ncbi:MAG: hypothetical protein DI551_02455 [Micavibrio aeruginosavorus]|uniref:Uncharacterized protein n=1 Tax=Micavibrio aeruginosavorus TaxID=349221 RepID=A0A2W5N422_9BACT|nr:MAG: hypothetical protein DI551_02455 [Micavibrio aeruginosavorus]